MHVLIRTHGGLGNQLFQLLYARLTAHTHGAPLFEIHDLRYRHGFTRSDELAQAAFPSSAMRALSALRLPKIATKLGFPRDAITVSSTVYLDGYFQRVADYAAFDEDLLRQELLRLREELNVPAEPVRDKGVHLRLGDFFSSEKEVAAHLDERLARIGDGAWIVTNEEERLASPAAARMLADAGARILPTGDMRAEEVLRTLASFRNVDGNDSTLLFWASALSGMECRYRDPELQALKERFIRALADAEKCS